MDNRKSVRKQKTILEPIQHAIVSSRASVRCYALMPWSMKCSDGRVKIEAYLATTGRREIIVEVRQTAGIDAEALAAFVVHAINSYGKTQELIQQMAAALEQCLACNLTWEAEFEADAMMRRAGQILKA